MIRRPPRSTQSRSSAASDVYKRQVPGWIGRNEGRPNAHAALLSGRRCRAGRTGSSAGRRVRIPVIWSCARPAGNRVWLTRRTGWGEHEETETPPDGSVSLGFPDTLAPVSYTHLRAHETR